MSSRRAIAAGAVLLAAGFFGCGEALPEIRVSGGWSRPTAPPPAPGVTYLSIVNDGRAPDRLLGAHSVCCGKIEIHRTTIVDDRARMAPVRDGVEIAAGATVEFEPGGYHLMLFGLSAALSPADRFEVVLEFERSGEVSVDVEVRRP